MLRQKLSKNEFESTKVLKDAKIFLLEANKETGKRCGNCDPEKVHSQSRSNEPKDNMQFSSNNHPKV